VFRLAVRRGLVQPGFARRLLDVGQVESGELRIVMRMTRRRVRPRWTPTNAERELIVLQSMGPDLASVYLLERGVL